MAITKVDDELWDEFHAVVTMTSRELREWLEKDSAGGEDEVMPEQAGVARSRAVVDILGKRRTDLTESDLEVMRSVVDEVRAERGDSPEPEAGDARWRRRLMSVGHDPLQP